MKSGTEIFQITDSYLLLIILAGAFKMEAKITPRNILQLIFPYISLYKINCALTYVSLYFVVT